MDSPEELSAQSGFGAAAIYCLYLPVNNAV
jgi:hypothetical protein